MLIALFFACAGPSGSDAKDASSPGPDVDVDGDGHTPRGNDCDEGAPDVHPGASDEAVDGRDADCNGTDGPTVALIEVARLVVTGDAEDDGLGGSVACSAGSVGGFASAIGIGADQSWQPTVEGSRGYALVFDGSTTGDASPSLASWRGDGRKYDKFGHRMAFPGDVYGDGDGELLVTAVSAYRPDHQTGAAFLFDLEHTGEVTPEEATTWFSDEAGAMLGGATTIGDVDGDGLADILLAATYWNWSTHVGEVRLYPATALQAEVPPSSATVVVPGRDPLTATGKTLTVGDLTGDGQLDLVVGEFQWEGRGRVLIVPGPVADWPASEPSFVSSTAESGEAGLGIAVGDLDDDGIADLVMGDHISDGEGRRRGVSHVFFGPLTADRTTAEADLTLRPEGDWAWWGAAHLIVDHDGDGIDDLVVAAPSDLYLGPPRAGLVYVFRGPLSAGEIDPTTASVVYEGAEPYDMLGWALAGCDLDHDGDDEIVIGAPGTAEGMPHRGRVFVVDGG